MIQLILQDLVKTYKSSSYNISHKNKCPFLSLSLYYLMPPFEIPYYSQLKFPALFIYPFQSCCHICLGYKYTLNIAILQQKK